MNIRFQRLITVIQIVYRRARRIAIAGLLLIVAGMLWTSTAQQSTEQLNQHSKELARIALTQARHEARYWLNSENVDGLQRLVDHLSEQPSILGASVSDQFGQNIARSGLSTDFVTWRNSSDHDAVALLDEIERDGRVSGYLQIIFDRDALLAQNQQTQFFLTQRGQLLLLLAVLAGMILMASFNRLRWRQPKTP